MDPDPHQFADDKPKCMSLFEHFFKGLYPDPHPGEKSDPDPQPQHSIDDEFYMA